ncbi:hypothetical protein L3Q82_000867 [Scortum barcoo]|uniref:Uncharacterized protein n=1 Tax=Scortum barcoo TaxID=214431 RepID=A0ACB8WDY0_9TELE|nr:hypothetical protein L3Q82_000867 [Scortum barcoo]
MKAAQQEVKHCVKEAKDSYRRKVEQKLREQQHEGSGTHFTSDEDVGAALPQPPQTPGASTPRIACSSPNQPGVGVEDAILYLLHRAHSHLDKGSGTVRILFLDFSSAFNTIQPTLLQDKLSRMGVDPQLMDWISDYLTGRPQYVGLKDITSDTVVSSTGAPQGTVLAPLLFTLYTSDFCYNSELCHIQKYADDTAIVGCIRDDREEEYRRLVVGNFAAWCHTNHLQLNTSKTKELVIDFGRSRPRPRPVLLEGAEKFSDDSAVVGLITDGDDREYRGLIQDFADWCLRNNLQINAGKTKELVVDFRRRRHSPPAPVSIQGTDIDTVKSYKYLGVHLNDNLDWSDNTNALVKKGNSRLFLLRRLRSFGVQGPLLRTFL